MYECAQWGSLLTIGFFKPQRRAEAEVMRVVFSAMAVICAAALTTVACTCVHDSLGKRFRKAEAIFVGTLADKGLYESPQNVQNYKDGRLVFLVEESFKGVRKKFIAVDIDLTGFSANCPFLTDIAEDSDYLIFAYGRELQFRAECPDSRELKAGYSDVIKQIGKLDSFWFRTKARLWPF